MKGIVCLFIGWDGNFVFRDYLLFKKGWNIEKILYCDIGIMIFVFFVWNLLIFVEIVE